MSFPKKCSLCGAHIPSLEAWNALPFIGDIGDEVSIVELRNHSCGTTLGLTRWKNTRVPSGNPKEREDLTSLAL